MTPNDTNAPVASLTDEQATLNAVPEKDRTPAQKARLVAIAAELTNAPRPAHAGRP